MSDLRPIDGNGHIPDTDGMATPADLREGHSAEWHAGYNQALLDFMFTVLKKAHEDLTATLERLAA